MSYNTLTDYTLDKATKKLTLNGLTTVHKELLKKVYDIKNNVIIHEYEIINGIESFASNYFILTDRAIAQISANSDPLQIEYLVGVDAPLYVDISGTVTVGDVTVVSSVLPTGASTSALQTSGNASLTSIDGKLPVLSGGSVPVTGPLTDAQLRATAVSVSAASLPLPSGAATETTLSSINTKTATLVSGRVPVDPSGVTSPISAASLPLPSGAATSAAQTTTNSSLSSIDGKLGTLGQKAMSGSQPVVIASDQSTLATGGTTTQPSANFTRPADTTAYASGDLVANSITAGSVVAMTFTVARVSGGSGFLRRCKLATSSTSVTNASFRLHLFKVAPATITNGDNGVFSVSGSADYVGAFDVTVDRVFTDGSVGVGLPVVGYDMGFKLASGTSVFGLVEARAAYTPTSSGTFTFTFDDLQD